MYLDILVLAIIAFGIFSGIKNGFFVEVIDIFALLLNILICKEFVPVILKFLKISQNDSNSFVTYIVVFVILYLIVKIILSFIIGIFKKQNKGFINRGIGGLVGLFKGFILAGIIILVYNYAAYHIPSLEKYSKNSKSLEMFIDVTGGVNQYIPEVFKKKVEEMKVDNLINRYLNKMW